MDNTNNKEEESNNDMLFSFVKNLTIDLPRLNEQMEEAIRKKGEQDVRKHE